MGTIGAVCKGKVFFAVFPHFGNSVYTVVLTAYGIYVATRYKYGEGIGSIGAFCKVGSTFVFPKFGYVAVVPYGIYFILCYEYGIGSGIIRAICKSIEFFVVFPHLGNLVFAVVLTACGIYISTYYEYGVCCSKFRAVRKVVELFAVFPHLGYVFCPTIVIAYHIDVYIIGRFGRFGWVGFAGSEACCQHCCCGSYHQKYFSHDKM